MALSDALLPSSAPRFLKAALARVSGLRALDHLYQQTSGDDWVRSALHTLGVRRRVSAGDSRRIPRTGATVIVANHPTGMLDGLILLDVLRDIRGDVRILGNNLLRAVPELAPFLIPLDVSGQGGNAGAVRAAIAHLAGGGVLIVFPAGEVSDAVWNPGVVRLLRSAGRGGVSISVVPVHLSGRASRAFRLAPHPKLRLLMLPRELLRQRGAEIAVSVGQPMDASRVTDISELRWRSELLGQRSPTRQEPIIEPIAQESLRCDVEALPADRRLGESGNLAVYIARAQEIPHVLREISRLREVTFRAAGEGTGRECDRDAFDEHYWHLFLWDQGRDAVAGAYRVVLTEDVRATFGVAGLYTSTLFSFREAFLDQLGPAIELGRSFVRAEYQRGFAPLLLLWRGIGRFVAMHPECRVLFGPVSISGQYQNLSRELMVAYLERRAPLHSLLHFVSSRMPFRTTCQIPEGLDFDELSKIIADLEPDGRGVPVLLRQYLRLGGRLLGFNLDPEFTNALDGLIVVDLLETDRTLLARYLGPAEARTILEFHKEAYVAR